ncbi:MULTISPECIES: glycoside hydrolase family 38 C-terminal domain-containing protein [Bacteroides]|uniref:glycoside hydrolase family 38 C-terminal domain-containing protein n=1 Tax=Bacteroides TaxID=816 RepID=UPI00189FAB68|nr:MULTISPECIES: glycoside hydrolase family 38 C-terminal domain-containing protein [Bacteroides]MDC2611324.1 glycoside hydrolase family 38 C-terminal domain-containing protein [Bacteroides ovatus]MDC2630546.1 glycoside hydrolase family 38 C-terminal domain-containing protein [Bacteroides ovatus]
MNKIYIILLTVFLSTNAYSQQAYFVDGYHGGIYGHYPVKWKTQFIVDQLHMHPDWRIGLEIEPETWDTIRVQTPEAYQHFKEVATSQQVEFTNPTYAQPYCYNISGESIIRQFQYGIAKINAHFPEVDFVTYSVEEPCFTSCLPQILKLFGFKYAVLKCPNTCWGGYTAAYGGELVNWVGPDGTSILAVPRYACEELEQKSTWQTTAWGNSDAYLKACRDAGIQHPVGMCFQDAGWKNGPWIGSGKNTKNNSIYMRWRDYIEKISIGKTDDDWHFSQEDMHVNLMWGSQVMQRIAQEVRTSENRIIMAEKMSVMAYLKNKYTCPQADMDEAWRTLMLAQHHDSWIVPYNGLNKQGTWADQIKRWTDSTNAIADGIIGASMQSFDNPIAQQKKVTQQQYIRVFNTLGTERKETMNVLLPSESGYSDLGIYDWKGKEIGCFVESEGEKIRLFFEADIPPFGYSTYCIKKKETGKRAVSGNEQVSKSEKVNEQEYAVENDMYKIVFDLSKGGIIKSLIAKKEGNKEFACKTGEYSLGELRGFFYEENKFHSSTETPGRLTVLRDNTYEKKVKVQGEIASHPFTQIITLSKGTKRIDFELTIDWKKNVGIGEYKENHWSDNRRAFCDDRFKLNVLFPADLHSPRIYKNAPFDVCESKLDNTFFNSWDQIKHNIILHWVDLAEQEGDYALALLSDHTTSYSHGKDYPLGLTAQYSGGGLWGPDYKITQPLKMKYAIIPHRGKWDKASIADDSDCWNEPLLYSCHSIAALESKSFVDLRNTGYQISTARLESGKIILRLFNAEGNDKLQKIVFDMPLSSVEEVDLNGQCIERKKIKTHAGKSEMTISMPRFGIKTFVLGLN